MKEDYGKCTGYSFTARITITDKDGITRKFTEKHVKDLLLVE